MTADEELIRELLLHGEMVITRALDCLPVHRARPIAEKLERGGAVELRIRVRAGYVPQIQIAVFHEGAEDQIATVGGTRSAP